ncbi:bifunctional protein-serine/threonine kinase/phosphatase [Thalassotalea agarivorans]|uniref:Protein phosphatase n=1 Tax=Thalassotalea agarivorans TaxID=349064 RepID=A0A1I0EBG6_THASX|nr:bifunctional protein-serine/threonine kinase/phosphatase [Thalassotalea agarivorans]SET42369.1 protein phosphatase [Thalassotalea agarivorans]
MQVDNKVSEAALDVAFGGYSHQGVKEENQDAFAAFQPSASVRQWKGSVACIADGASCSDKAQVASQTTVTTFINDYYSTPEAWSIKDSVSRILSSLNAWLFHHGQQMQSRQNELVTTFSGIVFKSKTAHIFHAGDSRIYLYRKGKLTQLTKDHTHFYRKEKHFLTRALGMDSHLQVDNISHELAPDDQYVLTTDGVHEALSHEQMTQLLATATSDSEQVAKAICEEAVAAGSQDNVSCLIAHVVNLPNPDLAEVHRQLTARTIPPVMSTGNKIDNFVIERVIHSGTRSHVYLARDQHDKKLYVLKAPSENFADDLAYLDGFMREQWVGSRINHPSIMRIYPRDEHNVGSPFLYHVCQYIEGKTLRQWMYDNPKPSLTQVREITSAIIVSLRVLQRQSMVHRDIKPENIMITESGSAVLIDFGTVQVSGLEEINSVIADETPVGAIGYMAPEYLLGQKGNVASDLFSLGVIVYEMLTGQLPYQKSLGQHADNKPLHLWNYISARKHRGDIPSWLDLTLEKATHPTLSKRYPAYSEFLADLNTPNQTMVDKIEHAPLIERNPLVFWKFLSLILFLLLIVQTIFNTN